MQQLAKSKDSADNLYSTQEAPAETIYLLAPPLIDTLETLHLGLEVGCRNNAECCIRYSYQLTGRA